MICKSNIFGFKRHSFIYQNNWEVKSKSFFHNISLDIRYFYSCWLNSLHNFVQSICHWVNFKMKNISSMKNNSSCSLSTYLSVYQSGSFFPLHSCIHMLTLPQVFFFLSLSISWFGAMSCADYTQVSKRSWQCYDSRHQTKRRIQRKKQ